MGIIKCMKKLSNSLWYVMVGTVIIPSVNLLAVEGYATAIPSQAITQIGRQIHQLA